MILQLRSPLCRTKMAWKRSQFLSGAKLIKSSGETQNFAVLNHANFLVAYCVASKKDFVMHFEDEDLCLSTKYTIMSRLMVELQN